ncbi:hypothetical protein MHH33_17200 [Paenisporosarcina sp. FSL H8-0542]|uniref:hypothetical protein n=1 Tax=unclassified Paenisporosarcina TaxID=2642018 RepID=UPI00034EBCBA|nr:hypothetical protein [Paenisporosarcina sp. HGH0030]EPD51048.1 hypothetical protein HMPREF1210_02239 [Paenisporosarcina sp. HGH0030]
MLAIFDKYQNIIISIILVFYIVNSIYIGSDGLSLMLFILVILMQIIRLRNYIKQLSFVQLLALFGILAGSIVALVLIFMSLNHLIGAGILSFPDWMIMVLQITLIILFILTVSAIMRNLYQRFTQSKV